MNRRRKPSTKEPQQNEPGSPQPGEPVFLVIGRLRRPHGVHGEMIFEILTDFPERIRPQKTVFVGEEKKPLMLSTRRNHDTFLLVSFEGLEGIDQVGVLRNQLVYVRTDSLPRLPEGEYYHHELLGCSVVDESQQLLGKLVEILETGANDVYRVETPDGEEILLPAIEAVIQKVDLERREIVVRPPEWAE